jgi:pimeloyl-ACP methyl ester carboxylesterase
MPIYATPASLGLQYKDVIFPSRDDHLLIRGWFIPGVLPNGHLTTQRTIIMVHGNSTNRADKGAGILNLSGALIRHAFAILAFDIRGAGESPDAPRSFGLYELYPELGRPRAIAGWGVSEGAATLILAAAKEPAIRAIVSDSAYADILPILEREIPKLGHLPPLFTPGGLIAAQMLYGVDYYNIRPENFVASIAPRPILFIQGDKDDFIPPSNMFTLAAAARTAPDADVQTWLVKGANHAQSYNTMGKAYVDRIVTFYTGALGPATSK